MHIHLMFTLILVFILIRFVFILILMFVLTLYSFFIHIMLILLLILMSCVLYLCSRACSYLNLYYDIHTQNSYVRTVREQNPRDSLTLTLYYLEHKHDYMLQPYLYAILFSEFMNTLNSYATSTSYADHATIGIIAGAHGIIVMGV
ncbi:hypothetical protein HanIR_Chr17g0887451 [Helianthus annuus]|nr:hypothetical protein HanIR_Chr17g0887451 [Helianthus annuus]